jgi:hypothetical protein
LAWLNEKAKGQAFCDPHRYGYSTSSRLKSTETQVVSTPDTLHMGPSWACVICITRREYKEKCRFLWYTG